MLKRVGAEAIAPMVMLLLSENGPLAKGEAFFASLKTWFEKDAFDALKSTLEILFDAVKAKLKEMNATAAALIDTVITALKTLVTAKPTDWANVATQGGLAWAKKLLQPFVDTMLASLDKPNVAVGCFASKPFIADVKALVNGALGLFDKPDALKTDATKVFTTFATSFDSKLRSLATCAYSEMSGKAEVEAFVGKMTFDAKAVARLLIQILDRYWGNDPIIDLVRFLVTGAFDLFMPPQTKLQALLKMDACTMFESEIAPWLKKLFPLVAKAFMTGTPAAPIYTAVFNGTVDLARKLICSKGIDWWKPAKEMVVELFEKEVDKFFKLQFDLRFPAVKCLWPKGGSLINVSVKLFNGPGNEWKFGSDFKEFFGGLTTGWWDCVKNWFGKFGSGGAGGDSDWKWPDWDLSWDWLTAIWNFVKGLFDWSWPNWGMGSGSGSGGSGGVGTLSCDKITDGTKKILDFAGTTLENVFNAKLPSIIKDQWPRSLVLKVIDGLKWARLHVKELCQFAKLDPTNRHKELVRMAITTLLKDALPAKLPETLKTIINMAITHVKDFKFEASASVEK
jgi:hypothetical protein